MPKKDQSPALSPAKTFEEAEEDLRQQLQKAEALVQLLRQTLDGIVRLRGGGFPAGRKPPTDTRYVGMDIGEAVAQYLEQVGTPLDWDTLKEEIRDGGGLAGRSDPNASFASSITYHKKSATQKAQEYKGRIQPRDPTLKEINGRIGLFTWGEEKWEER
jgi:hypothetical protein